MQSVLKCWLCLTFKLSFTNSFQNSFFLLLCCVAKLSQYLKGKRYLILVYFNKMGHLTGRTVRMKVWLG